MGNRRNKIALITGITGQDGSYLTEFVVGQGLYRARDYPPQQLVQHRPHRSLVQQSEHLRQKPFSAPRRSHRLEQSQPFVDENQAGRDL